MEVPQPLTTPQKKHITELVNNLMVAEICVKHCLGQKDFNPERFEYWKKERKECENRLREIGIMVR